MTVILTLVGTRQAKNGLVFLHCGEVDTCKECKLLKVCQKLEPGRVYEVVKSRGISHPCAVHEDGVTLVEVKEATILAALESRSCIPGASVVYAPKKCSRIDCDRMKECSPLGLRDGDRCKVEDIVEKMAGKCSVGRQLSVCKLRRVTTTLA